MVNDVLEDSDGIINKITEQSDLSKEDLMDKIDEKIEDYGGLLTEAGAAYSIAKEMGIEKGKKKQNSEAEDVEVKDLEDGQGNVNLEARVKRIYATNTFQRDGEEGNVTNIEVKDNTGETTAVLWNKKPLVDRMEKNTPIRISNGYVKERNDDLRVNVGSYGTVEMLEQSEIPEITEETKKISELEPGMDNVDLYARVERVFPMNTFQKQDREGKVTNLYINDGEDRKRLVCWGEHAEEAQKLDKNSLIKVEGGYTKENRERVELHLGWKGRLKTNPETDKQIPEIKTERKTIEEIKNSPEGQETTVKATIVQAYEPTLLEVCPKCGEMIRDGECKQHGSINDPKHVPILNLVLDDGEDTVRSTLYRERAEEIMNATGEEIHSEEKSFPEVKKEILGEEKLFTGRVEHNDEFDRYEFTVTSLKDLDLDREIEKLKGEKNV